VGRRARSQPFPPQSGFVQVGLDAAKPPREMLSVLSRSGMGAEPLFERAFSCLIESVTLVELRDSLLPKLLSGELQIKEAEKTVGARL
jgi:hypothetical protein